MSVTISAADVKYVASLAKIAVSNQEAEDLAKELEVILGYVRQLSDVDTNGLEPTYQVTGLKNISRPDEIIDYKISREELLKNVPKQRDGSVEVPKVL